MNILALIIDEESLDSVIDYAKKISDQGDKIHLLNIVNVAGNIPTKKTTGEVLDGCTEFDITPYYNERRQNENWMAKAVLGNQLASSETIVGNRYAILKNHVEKNKIDLVVTSTEQTSNVTDFFKYTSAGIIHDKLDIPVLAFKCDRSQENITDIAIVSDYEQTEKEDISIIKKIGSKSNATITLYGFIKDENLEKDLDEKMNRFISLQDLLDTKKVIITTKNKEKSAHDILMTYPIQLMVLMDLHRSGINKIFKGDHLEKDLLNHQLIPILAF